MRLQMQVLYEDEACKIANGHSYYYHANGYPSIVGRMAHGKQEAVCLRYHYNGMMMDSAAWHNGKPAGSRFSWHRNGVMSDSTGHVNDSMDVHIGWFEDGAISFAGYLLNSEHHGKWQYFHRNGKLAAIELYNKGVALNKQYFNEDGAPQTDTSKANSSAVFAKGGLNGWKKYLERNLHWPSGLKFSTGTLATVGVDFAVNEEGKIEDAEVSIPFHPEFDKIALRIIKESPSWIPAVWHNRKVKSWHRQPVTFQEEE